MLGSLSKALKTILGDKSQKDIRELQPYVKQTLVEYEKLSALSHDELRAITAEIKKEISDSILDLEKEIQSLKLKADAEDEVEAEEKDGLFKQIDKLEEKIDSRIEEVLMKVLPRAFAVMRETARRFKENETLEVTATDFDRDMAAQFKHVEIAGDKAIWHNTWMAAGNPVTWDMVHYEVQLIGGIVLHQGKVAEMATGEGKTLVATLPVFLNALAGRGVHLVTVNDYLAKRDSEWMAPLFQWHGLTVDCIDKHQPNSEDRKKAYLADITYGTNNEFGFDYLRDNMTADPDNIVQKKLHYAIIDEVDSVLIDDARTPLIISGPTPRGDIHEFDAFRPKVEKLFNAQRQLVTNLLAEAKKRLKGLDENKLSKEDLSEGGLALLRAYRGLPKNKALIKYLSEPGVKQHLLKTEAYYLQDQSKEMPKVDAELYFSIDEKNNQIDLNEKGVDLISDDTEDASFFILPDMGGKIAEIEESDAPESDKKAEKESLMRDYGVKAERIHTINQLLRAYTLYERDIEYVVMDNKVKIVDEQTGRIMEGRRYSDGLHQAIESKEQVKVEAATQTYATVTLQNFFRMYHKLAGMTGTAETEAGELWDIYELDVVVIPTNRPVVRDDREDKVYKTKREKYNSVIEEIVELQKAGRPILVGTTSVEVSELLSRMLKMQNIPHNVLNAKLHSREAEIVAHAGKSGAVTIATNMAGRGTDIKLDPESKKAGGLAIVGTEKHESRRIDRQLRGRSGRQGDPGSSQFYVSLEDNLMRIFGSDRIAKMMDRLGLKEGEVIQHSMITRSIERAQRKVEENNFGIRKRLLEYDDVMNAQREVIYKRRKHALFGDRLKLDIANMFHDVVESIVLNYADTKNYEGYKFDLYQFLITEPPISEEEFSKIGKEQLIQRTFKAVFTNYQQKMRSMAEQAMPVIKNVFETQRQFQNIQIPFAAGPKTLSVVVNLEKTVTSNGKELIDGLEKNVVLGIIDNEWKEHLREMDDLRTSVQNAVYEQKDPLLIYKLEAFELFRSLVEKINFDTVTFLAKGGLPVQDNTTPEVRATSAPTRPREDDLSRVRTGRTEVGSDNGQGPDREQAKPQPVRTEEKIGRNDPCPCGSGKKYKHCHGKVAQTA